MLTLLPQLSTRIPRATSTKLAASEVHLSPDAPYATQQLNPTAVLKAHCSRCRAFGVCTQT